MDYWIVVPSPIGFKGEGGYTWANGFPGYEPLTILLFFLMGTWLYPAHQ